MTEKSELLAEIARSRAAIARDAASVREELDVAARLKNSVRKRPFAWLGAAAAFGYILAGPKTRTKTVTKLVKGPATGAAKAEKKRPRTFLDILLALFKLALPLVRPALSAYAARSIGGLADKFGRT